jgi:predicted HicB family RNase H-like nuclease
MNTLTYKGYTASIDFDAKDRLFVGRIAGINDIVGFHGASVDELTAAFEEAVDDYLASCAKIGRSPEKPYSGKVMFRIKPEIHAKAALAAQLAGKSLNQWAEDVLEKAV